MHGVIFRAAAQRRARNVSPRLDRARRPNERKERGWVLWAFISGRFVKTGCVRVVSRRGCMYKHVRRAALSQIARRASSSCLRVSILGAHTKTKSTGPRWTPLPEASHAVSRRLLLAQTQKRRASVKAAISGCPGAVATSREPYHTPFHTTRTCVWTVCTEWDRG